MQTEIEFLSGGSSVGAFTYEGAVPPPAIGSEIALDGGGAEPPAYDVGIEGGDPELGGPVESGLEDGEGDLGMMPEEEPVAAAPTEQSTYTVDSVTTLYRAGGIKHVVEVSGIGSEPAPESESGWGEATGIDSGDIASVSTRLPELAM